MLVDPNIALYLELNFELYMAAFSGGILYVTEGYVCYTIPISKFKANPSAALAEAQGDAIAVSSNNQIQFYAVPAHMYEEIINFVEFAQRGTTELKNIPDNFTGEGLDMNQVATEMATKLKHGSTGDYEEWS